MTSPTVTLDDPRIAGLAVALGVLRPLDGNDYALREEFFAHPWNEVKGITGPGQVGRQRALQSMLAALLGGDGQGVGQGSARYDLLTKGGLALTLDIEWRPNGPALALGIAYSEDALAAEASVILSVPGADGALSPPSGGDLVRLAVTCREAVVSAVITGEVTAPSVEIRVRPAADAPEVVWGQGAAAELVAAILRLLEGLLDTSAGGAEILSHLPVLLASLKDGPFSEGRHDWPGVQAWLRGMAERGQLAAWLRALAGMFGGAVTVSAEGAPLEVRVALADLTLILALDRVDVAGARFSARLEWKATPHSSDLSLTATILDLPLDGPVGDPLLSELSALLSTGPLVQGGTLLFDRLEAGFSVERKSGEVRPVLAVVNPGLTIGQKVSRLDLTDMGQIGEVLANGFLTALGTDASARHLKILLGLHSDQAVARFLTKPLEALTDSYRTLAADGWASVAEALAALAGVTSTAASPTGPWLIPLGDWLKLRIACTPGSQATLSIVVSGASQNGLWSLDGSADLAVFDLSSAAAPCWLGGVSASVATTAFSAAGSPSAIGADRLEITGGWTRTRGGWCRATVTNPTTGEVQLPSVSFGTDGAGAIDPGQAWAWIQPLLPRVAQAWGGPAARVLLDLTGMTGALDPQQIARLTAEPLAVLRERIVALATEHASPEAVGEFFDLLQSLLTNRAPPPSFPGIPVPDLPVHGCGSREAPWTIPLHGPGQARVELLAWVDPLVPPHLVADAVLGGGDGYTDWRRVVTALGTLAGAIPGVAQALRGRDPAVLAAGLSHLAALIEGGDGAVTVSDDLAAGWTVSARAPDGAPLFKAPHHRQLQDADLVDALAAWIAPNATVILFAPPWAGERCWVPLLNRLGGGPAEHISLRRDMVAPEAVDLSAVPSARRYVVDLGDDGSWRLDRLQSLVGRVVARVRELRPQDKIVLVGHSYLGTVAAQYAAGAGIEAVATIGAPLAAASAAAPWSSDADPEAADALAMLMSVLTAARGYLPGAMAAGLDLLLWGFGGARGGANVLGSLAEALALPAPVPAPPHGLALYGGASEDFAGELVQAALAAALDRIELPTQVGVAARLGLREAGTRPGNIDATIDLRLDLASITLDGVQKPLAVHVDVDVFRTGGWLLAGPTVWARALRLSCRIVDGQVRCGYEISDAVLDGQLSGVLSEADADAATVLAAILQAVDVPERTEAVDAVLTLLADLDLIRRAAAGQAAVLLQAAMNRVLDARTVAAHLAERLPALLDARAGLLNLKPIGDGWRRTFDPYPVQLTISRAPWRITLETTPGRHIAMTSLAGLRFHSEVIMDGAWTRSGEACLTVGATAFEVATGRSPTVTCPWLAAPVALDDEAALRSLAGQAPRLLANALISLLLEDALGQPVRCLDPLLRDPIGWFRSATGMPPSAEAIQALLEVARSVIGPLPVVIDATAGTVTARYEYSADPVTARVEAALGADGRVSANSTVRLRAPIPGGTPWQAVEAFIQAGTEQVTVGADFIAPHDKATVTLWPQVGGFEAVARATAEQLLPTLIEKAWAAASQQIDPRLADALHGTLVDLNVLTPDGRVRIEGLRALRDAQPLATLSKLTPALGALYGPQTPDGAFILVEAPWSVTLRVADPLVLALDWTVDRPFADYRDNPRVKGTLSVAHGQVSGTLKLAPLGGTSPEIGLVPLSIGQAELDSLLWKLAVPMMVTGLLRLLPGNSRLESLLVGSGLAAAGTNGAPAKPVWIDTRPTLPHVITGLAKAIAEAGAPFTVDVGPSLIEIRPSASSNHPVWLERLSVSMTNPPKVTIDRLALTLGGPEDPLIDIHQPPVRLDRASLTGSVDIDSAGPTLREMTLELDGLAIPLAPGAATGGSNAVAGMILSGGGGDSEPVHPAMKVTVSYSPGKDIKVTFDNNSSKVIDVHRAFGPLTIDTVTLEQGSSEIRVGFDGAAAISGLDMRVMGLSMGAPLAQLASPDKWTLDLDGLALHIDSGPVVAGGSLVKVSTTSAGVAYRGGITATIGDNGLTAIGEYAKFNGYGSLYVFGVYQGTIGGPPPFYVTGLAGGLGYNNRLLAPAEPADVPGFPLIVALDGKVDQRAAIGDRLRPERGCGWFAAGIRFTSYAVVKGTALAYVSADGEFEVGLLGTMSLRLPEKEPLLSVELAIAARYSTRDNVLIIRGQLTDRSWLISKDCTLTGGFAVGIWPSNGIVTVGGYGPFKALLGKDYPDVPPVQFNWHLDSGLTVKGSSYAALAPHALVFGTALEAALDYGWIRAWLRAHADAMLAWEPLSYDVDIGVAIGAEVRLSASAFGVTVEWTVGFSVGGTLHIEGPPMHGTITLKHSIASLTVPFGDPGVRQNWLTWNQFGDRYLWPEKQIKTPLDVSVIQGLAAEPTKYAEYIRARVAPEFIIRLDSRMPLQGINGTYRSNLQAVNIVPMSGVSGVRTNLSARIDGANVETAFSVKEIEQAFPAAIWDRAPSQGASTKSSISGLASVVLAAKPTKPAEFVSFAMDHTTVNRGGLPVPKSRKSGIDLPWKGGPPHVFEYKPLAPQVQASHAGFTLWTMDAAGAHDLSGTTTTSVCFLSATGAILRDAAKGSAPEGAAIMVETALPSSGLGGWTLLTPIMVTETGRGVAPGGTVIHASAPLRAPARYRSQLLPIVPAHVVMADASNIVTELPAGFAQIVVMADMVANDTPAGAAAIITVNDHPVQATPGGSQDGRMTWTVATDAKQPLSVAVAVPQGWQLAGVVGLPNGAAPGWHPGGPIIVLPKRTDLGNGPRVILRGVGNA